jgi:hypothetical protein
MVVFGAVIFVLLLLFMEVGPGPWALDAVVWFCGPERVAGLGRVALHRAKAF